MVESNVKLFGKWSWEGITIRDESLKDFICLRPIYVPWLSQGRHAKKRFGKAQVNIVERLVNKLALTGHLGTKEHKRTSGRNVGKKQMLCWFLEKAFDYIYEQTKENPIQVLVRAVENAAPLEEIVLIEVGGIRYPKAVDVSPQRRVDLALKWIATGAYHKSISTKRPFWLCLAEEILYASKRDMKSWAIQKRFEIERQAAAAR